MPLEEVSRKQAFLPLMVSGIPQRLGIGETSVLSRCRPS
jgi:hypothetical protein